MALPLWISQDQAERLKALLEENEFEAVMLGDGPRPKELVIAAEWQSYGHKVSAFAVSDLDGVLDRFLKWRDQRNG